MNFAGVPAHISEAGIFLFTIDPAPITAFSPMVMELQITELHPINEFFPICTCPKLNFAVGFVGSKKCANTTHPVVI